VEKRLVFNPNPKKGYLPFFEEQNSSVGFKLG
jgi:hypothetical protein